MKEFKEKIEKTLTEFESSQDAVLQKIACEVAIRVKKGGRLYVVGTGHSHMVGEEFYGRAGGLACIELIAPMELTLGEHPLKSTQIERISEYANVIFTQYKITNKDMLMICSNSGRNGLPVELALQCRQKGISTIAFTNVKHSSNVTSRHASHKNLYQICDYVIDNCGEVGDATISLTGVKGKMGATSSLIGMYMSQTLSMYIASELVKIEIEPPVFISANVDAGDNWNQKIMEEYYHI